MNSVAQLAVLAKANTNAASAPATSTFMMINPVN